ncbi:MAG: HlyD family secretion protein, partial [Sedimentisphaerales bacterium]|nr:HlyD family secretion protein [Sedimentisphaerales bacterium]
IQTPLVASLENTELPCEAVRLTARIEQTKIDIAQWQNRDKNQVEQLRQRLETLLNDETRLKEQIAGLKVKVPFTGEILTLDQDINRMRGQYITRATPLLLLADTRQLTAKVWVPENTYARIFKHEGQTGQQAELMLYAFSRDRFEGSVGAVSLHREDNMGEFGEKLALSNKVGGEVLTEYDPIAEQEKPVETVYEVTIDLDSENLPASAQSFRPYMSGRARIDCGQYTLYQWGKDSLLRFISPEVRL